MTIHPNSVNVSSAEVMAGFHPAVRTWFTENFTAPSPPQVLGWPAINAGQNVLILAATGTGKTLAAFLEVMSRLYINGTGRGVQVLYVSPLKALNNDVAKNLMEPIRGVAAAAQRLGLSVPEIKVAVRTGDTPQSARQAMLRKPPDILITTPESLYLMLSSPRAREILSPVHTVIVDEIHALAGNKRGVHLALSLERLEHLANHTLQRIGLSATQRPLELIARYLGGQKDGLPRPVQILDARLAKEMVVSVEVGPTSFIPAAGKTIWPDIYARVLAEINAHRSTLVFVNMRAQAERVAMGINELAGEMVARTHHGSLSRQAREEVETALKKGELRALVCTSTLELGIDVGAVDLVVQITSPRSASSGLQRIGRSGHVLGAASLGIVLAKSPDDLLDAAWVGREMRRGEVEETRIPENCLDVVAQHIVSMVAVEDWSLANLLALVNQAYPFRNLSNEQLVTVVEMLSGRYPARDYAELRPKVAWDRTVDVLHALPGTRAAAVAGAGTIPDRAYFPVYLAGQDVRIGELEEEFVHESHSGDAFILGNSIWRIQSISDNRVVVAPAPGAVPKMPFWNGDKSGRGLEAGRRLGSFWREVTEQLGTPQALQWLVQNTGVDERAAFELTEYLSDQVRHAGCVPTDRCLLLESYTDEAGDHRIILHSPYGYRIHSAWEMAARQQAREELGYELVSVATDYGIAWHVPRGQATPPLETLVYLGSDIEQRLMHELPATALFGAHFRMAAARSLVLGRSSPRRRVPLWLQRLKAGDLLALARKESTFPVALEAFRECLQDVLDVPGLVELQQELSSGKLRLEYRHTVVPSPFARAFILQLTAGNMYNDDTPRAEKKAQFLSLDRELLQEMLGDEELRSLLDPAAIEATVARRQRCIAGVQARNSDELEEILLDVGDLAENEVLMRVTAPNALSELQAAGRAVSYPFPVAPSTRYIAAEERPLYVNAYEAEGQTRDAARLFLLRRFTRTHGPFTSQVPAVYYGWPVEQVNALCTELHDEGVLQRGAFLPGGNETEWCHRDVLQEVHRRTLAALRSEVEAVHEADYARFLVQWQHIGEGGKGPDALATVLDQLASVFLPVEVWERDVLPARLPGYDPAWLDLLCARGEFIWIMQPGGSEKGRLAFLRREDVPVLWPLLSTNADGCELSVSALAVEGILQQKGAAFTAELAGELAGSVTAGTTQVQDALWELALAGRVSNDTFEPVRRGKPVTAAVGIDNREDATAGSMRAARGRVPAHIRRTIQQRINSGMSTGGGRWSLLVPSAIGESDSFGELEESLERLAEILLERWGVICRDMLVAEGLERWWQPLYRTLRVLEMTGRVRGGYFAAGLSGSQFAHPDAVEAMRTVRNANATTFACKLLVTCDPACAIGPLYGAGLPSGTGFTRSALNYAVYCNGQLYLYVTGYGRNLWSPAHIGLPEVEQALSALPQLLAVPGHLRPRRSLVVAAYNGDPIMDTPIAAVLQNAGYQNSGDTLVLWPSHFRTQNELTVNAETADRST